MYQLQKLNVVKTTDSEHKRDALLAKGFELIEEKKASAKSTTKAEKKSDNDRSDAQVGQTESAANKSASDSEGDAK